MKANLGANRYIILIMCLTIPFFNFGQNDSKSADEANKAFKTQDYVQALEWFQKIDNQEKYALEIGICYYQLKELDNANAILTQYVNNKNVKPDAYYWLGKTYQFQQEFNQAVQNYKLFLKIAKDSDFKRQAEVKNEIKRCASGMYVLQQENLGFLEYLPSSINTPYHEIGPVFSINYPERLYFSSNRPNDEIFPQSNMYGVEIQHGQWTDIFPMNEKLNTSLQEVLLGFSSDGQLAYYYQGDQEKAFILVDTLVNAQNGTISQGQLKCPLNPTLGDHYMQLIGNILIFASTREGGFGGYDLYITTLVDDEWSYPINLGPTVNSPFDEVSPFLANNQNTLYFSSNRTSSVGGFDIFETNYTTQIGWVNPKNIGLPINSAGNDMYFRISNSGRNAVFSSDRNGTDQGFDLFYTIFKQPIKSMLDIHPGIRFWDETDIFDGFANTGTPKPTPLIIPYLLYNVNEQILNPYHIKQLSELVSAMKQHPTWNIDISGHSDDTDLDEYNLFFSAKRAEEIADYFINQGIESSRIFIIGVGSGFPIALNNVNGLPNPSGHRFNRRIEFVIHDSSDDPGIFNYESPVIVNHFRDTAYSLYDSLTQGLCYKLFLQKSSRPYLPDSMRELKGIMIEKYYQDQSFEYTIGLVKTFFEANQMKRVFKDNGFEDTRVLAYINGRKIENKEVAKFSESYPDLVYFRYRSE